MIKMVSICKTVPEIRQYACMFAVFLLLFHFDGFGQRKEVTFDHLSMKDGLSMNPIMTIEQDNTGFLWFGTPDGLNRYDGYSFKIFKSVENDPKSLSDNFITALAIGKKGNVWVGTLSNGLNEYDSKTGQFTRFLKNDEHPMIVSNTIWSLNQDKRGMLWVGTDKGVTVIDTKNSQNVAFLEDHPALVALNNLTVLKVFEDIQGVFWFGTTSGLIKYNPTNQQVDIYQENNDKPKSLSNNIVLDIYQDIKQTIWIGTVDGLNKYNSKGDNFKTFYFKKGISEEDKKSNSQTNYSLINIYSGNTIRGIIEDEYGTLWMGTDMELVRFNIFTEEYVSFKKDLNNVSGINDHFIRALFKDKSGNLWIGTMGSGLNKVDLKPRKFAWYKKKFNDPTSISQNYVRAIAEDHDGHVWMGTLVGGLNKFLPDQEEFVHYPYDPNKPGLTPNGDNVWSLLVDKENILWIGTNSGLNRYDIETEQFAYFSHDAKNPKSISQNTVRSLFEDADGVLWVGTDKGLNRLDKKSGTFKRYLKHGDDNTSISDNTIWRITQDRRGSIWVATDDGLNKMNPKAEKFKHYRKDNRKEGSLSHSGIRTLYVDSRGVLWVGTQKGLCKLNESSDTFACYDEKDGLPNSFIYSILEDVKGHLWISTNRGISELDTSTMSFTNYDIYDGLQDYEYNNNACTRTISGEMYFGGPRGVNRFSPTRIPINSYEPPIEITDIKVLNKPIENELETSQLQQLTLDYDQNIVSFEFSSFDFTNPARNLYQYKMEGFNDDWSPMDIKRFTTYTNLDPGHYVFKVRGTNSDGIWNKELASIEIDILPPFWKTNLFYALIIISILSIIYLVYKARVRALESSKRVLEHQVKLRTQEVVNQKEELEDINVKLAESNSELEKLSIVASETDNAVIIMNEKTEFEWANEGFTKLSGYTLEGFREEYGNTLIGTSSNDAIKDLVEQCITEKKSVVYETRQKKITGEEFWVQSTLTPIFDTNGTFRRLVDINTDITQRKLAEELVKEKNQDITSSIKYAKQIQEAILPLRENFQKRFPDSFILYKPKDIVSGDFYWMSAQSKFTLVAACDCTGHGVPGAFMSMIGNSLLNEIVNVKKITQPAKVLNVLREEIIKALKQQKGFHLGDLTEDEEKREVKDGMDAALCKIDMEGLTLEYAGAYNPLYLIRNNANSPVLEETKGDKWPIGVWLGDYQKFTNHKIQLEKGDMVYMFSDGFVDQFGGPRGKKFRAAQFRKLLLRLADETMLRQGEILDKTLTDWQGEFEQVDDVLVIGIRI